MVNYEAAGRRYDFDALRMILIMVVVVGRATFYSNVTLFGEIDIMT